MNVKSENEKGNYSDEYYCSDCGKEVELIEESCPHCGAKFELPTKKFSYDDLKEVSPFARHFYSEIIYRYPEWDKYAEIDSFQGQTYITIKIPSPVEGVFPVEITSYEEVPQEVTVHFGPSHIHMRMYKPFEQKFLVDQLDNVETIVQDIFDEELISTRSKKAFLDSFRLDWCPLKNISSYLILESSIRLFHGRGPTIIRKTERIWIGNCKINLNKILSFPPVFLS